MAQMVLLKKNVQRTCNLVDRFCSVQTTGPGLVLFIHPLNLWPSHQIFFPPLEDWPLTSLHERLLSVSVNLHWALWKNQRYSGANIYFSKPNYLRSFNRFNGMLHTLCSRTAYPYGLTERTCIDIPPITSYHLLHFHQSPCIECATCNPFIVKLSPFRRWWSPVALDWEHCFGMGVVSSSPRCI